MKDGKGRSKVNTQISELSKRETLAHYTAVRIEDLLSKMDYVIESVDSLETSINARIDVLQAEMNRRFNDLEAVVKSHSVQLKALAM